MTSGCYNSTLAGVKLTVSKFLRSQKKSGDLLAQMLQCHSYTITGSSNKQVAGLSSEMHVGLSSEKHWWLTDCGTSNIHFKVLSYILCWIILICKSAHSFICASPAAQPQQAVQHTCNNVLLCCISRLILRMLLWAQDTHIPHVAACPTPTA